MGKKCEEKSIGSDTFDLKQDYGLSTPQLRNTH